MEVYIYIYMRCHFVLSKQYDIDIDTEKLIYNDYLISK